MRRHLRLINPKQFNRIGFFDAVFKYIQLFIINSYAIAVTKALFTDVPGL